MCTAAPAGTVFLDAVDNAFCRLVVAETHQHLIQFHGVQDFVAGIGQPLGEAARMPAGPFDQFSQTAASKRLHRRPDLYPPRATRQFRYELARIPVATFGQIGCCRRHRRTQALGIADERETAVV